MGKRTARRIKRQQEERRRRLIPIVVVTALALMAAGALILPNISANPIPERPNPQGTSMGDPNAPVKVEEFSDFQCPYCARYHLEQEPEIIEKYVSTGQVYVTFTPFSFLGPESFSAAEAAYCALDQGKFWEYTDTLYRNQSGENRGAFSDNRLQAFAREIGLNMDEFNDCYQSGKYEQAVLDDRDTAQERGVNATPMFFVNGKGPLSSLELEGAIQTALESAPDSATP